MTEIPKRITEDQYDKLSRRLWEMEQKLSAQEKIITDSVSIGMVFDRQRDIMERLDDIEYWIKFFRESNGLLLRAENIRIDRKTNGNTDNKRPL